MEKSQLVFSSNVQPDLASRRSIRFGIPISRDFGLYLGMPFLHKRVGKGTYYHLVEKARKKAKGLEEMEHVYEDKGFTYIILHI